MLIDLNCDRPCFAGSYPLTFREAKVFNLLKGINIMSTESASDSTTINQTDPNRIVTIKLKACEAEMIRNIAACLARPLDESRNALLRVCNATPEEMMKIHHKVYSAEMGWHHLNWDE